MAESGLLAPGQGSLYTNHLLMVGAGLKRLQGSGLEGDLMTAFEKFPFYLGKLDHFTKLNDKSGANKKPMGTEKEVREFSCAK